ncbi:GNAT family N-acetyltransferase [Erysipelotrichaceae bacterium OttesenSCG-928-M19]|nr:GNAT family N-acetyltransferase [Erysipelotrichaceae bacterium OttesenSCG-928-M19]
MITTRIPDYYLKQATIDDVELVYDFIIALADYEEMKDGVVGSVDDLKKSIFENGEAEVLIGYYQNKPVGFCVFCKIFSTFLCQSYLYLDDLFILEDYRKLGLGKEMLCQLGLICEQRKLERIEWFCFGWNKPSLDFYDNVLKATLHPELKRYRWEKDAIRMVIDSYDK